MTEIAAPTASRPVVPVAAERSDRRFQSPPELLWGACIAAQVAIAAILTSYTYFFFDDFLFLRQAQVQPFGRTYLAEGLFQHFSPATRLLNKLIVNLDPGSFAFAHGVQLALYACAIGAFAFVVRSILGRTWLAFGLTILFGQSVFLIRLLNWWTATANLLPATIFMLVALGCYLRWRDAGDRRWLIASLVAFAGALLDYETAMLFPAYLLMIRLVILGDSLDPREWARLLWRERWSWAAYFALDAAALINYYTRYYVTMPRPPAGQVIHFVEIALVQSFTPALFGVAHPPTPGTAAVAAAGLLFCLLATVVLYLRPRAWRCLVLALIAFLLSLLPLGLNRIRLFGVYVGAELYYQQSAQFMFLVLTAFALSPRWGGRRDRGSTRIRLPRVRARVLVPVALAVAAVYGALYVSSVDSLRDSSWEPRTARSYFDTFLADAARVRASTGSDPNLIDTTVQGNMMPASFYPYNLYSFFFAVVTPHLRYDQGAGPSYVVGLSGALQRVRFAPAATGLLRRPACVSAGVEQRLRVKLDRTVRFPASVNGRAAAVEASYRLPGRTDVGVLRAPAGSPPVPVDFEQHFWGPGSGTGIAVIGGPATIGEVDLDLRGPGCIDHLAVGSFVPQAR